MDRQRKYLMAASAFVLSFPAVVMAADSFDSLGAALSGGTPNVEARARWEHAEQENPTLDIANAYTLRARVGYTTKKWNELNLLTEFSGTFAYGPQAYNSGTNGKSRYATIGDPKGTQLNQFALDYTGLAGNDFKIGRQRLILDNQRFVGNSDWRQSEVTFDAFSAVNTQLPKTKLTYAYLARVNDKNFTNYQLSGHLFNAGYAAAPQINLVGYAYLLDFANNAAATKCGAVGATQRCDSQTYGLRATGTFAFDAVKLIYTAEYAHQNHYGEAPGSVNAGYYLTEFGAISHGVTAKLGYEDMQGDGKYSFQTPLATLHLYDGWADMFLNTPAKGLRDAYLRVDGDAPWGIKLVGVYHDFRIDEGHDKLGTEMDLQAVKSINKNLGVMVKYAEFRSSTNASPLFDTRKAWVQAQYKF